MSDMVRKIGDDVTRRSLPVWVKVIGGLVAAIALMIVGWGMLSGGTLLGDAHSRNIHDLDVAAQGLETWPDSLRMLARAQFIAGNVRPASGRQQDDGWTYRVEVIHPTMGRYQILYTVRADEAACAALRADVQQRERMRLPFIASNRTGEGPQLKIIDSMPLRDLFRADHAADVPLPVGNIRIDGIAAGPWPSDAALCYGTVIPIDRLLAIRSSRTQFVDYLIVDGDGRVVRQIGAPQVPIDFIDQLKPQDTMFNMAFAAAMPTSRETMAAGKSSRLADALDPVPLTVARQSFTGYVRPFHLPPGVPGCEPVAIAARATIGVGPPPTCFLVGLVPRDALRHTTLAIAPLPGTVFVLLLVLLLALVPTLQLLLIGPGEAVPRPTAIFAVAGLVFAVGVATIATAFAADVVRERDGARRQGQAIAARMAVRVVADIRGALAAAIGTARANRVLLAGATTDTRLIEARPFDGRLGTISAGAQPSRLFGTLNLIGADGRNLACGARTLRFSESAGSRTDVGGRAYFDRIGARIFDGAVPGIPAVHYVIDQVRSQTDGINKTTLALAARPLFGASRRSPPCQPIALLATTILPDLVAPVLPSPFAYMIVDGRAPDATLPVLFHSEEQRAGAETLTNALDDDGVAALRRWWSEHTMAQGDAIGAFRARYDGGARQFAAAPINGTPWMLLVDHSLDGVDRTAARTALLALGNWISWCTGSTLLYWVTRRLYLLARQRSYSMGADIARMWPRERFGRPYRALAVALLAIAAVATILLIASWGIAPSRAVVLAALVAGGACTGIFVALGRPAGTVGALRPDTERDYPRMLGAAALCIAVIPALALWGDARAFVTVQNDAQVLARLTGPAGAIATWRNDVRQLAATAAMAVPAPLPRQAFADCGADAGCFAGLVARPRAETALHAADYAGMTGTLARWIGSPAPALRTCPPTSSDIAGLRTLCSTAIGPAQQFGIGAHRAPLLGSADGGWIGLSLVAAIAAALVGGLWHLLGRVLRALAGFGIPLEAISRPNLYIGDRSCAPPIDIATPLPARALIVGAPMVLREHFVHAAGPLMVGPPVYTQVDLAAPGSLRLGSNDDRIVAFGLQLVLNDSDRRREALQRLEACDRHVRAAPGRRMVIMSALSPLERIIDAYERDRDDMGGDQSVLKYREQLRWSLLLEHYATFSFRAIDNYNPDRRRGRSAMLLANLDEALRSTLPADERLQRMRIVETMLAEIRWLPAHVIESAIGVDITGRIARLAARRRSRANIFPLSDIHYQWVIVPLVIDWALRLKPASRAATIDYLRGSIIEHYQQCWSASTLAERVVLDHLAHDRFVNVASACTSLSALVRRGLVVFDPTPRLMNQSFRMFVRQAERPERIREWRALQPVGAWARARLPLLVGLPVVAVAMLVAAIWSGVEPTLVLPLLLAGLPALLSQVTQLFRSPAR